ncbi:hypothetical protein AB3S75_025284 [Citrus x aurantiifolia]
MTGGGGESPPTPACNGGEFLLSVLQKPQQHPQAPPHPTPPQQPSLPNDPAVAAVGPTINFPPQWPSNGGDLPPTWPRTPLPLNFLGFPQNPWASPSTENQQQRLLCEDLGRLGFSNANYAAIHNLIQLPNHQQQQQQQNLRFGSFQVQPDSLLNLNPLDNLKYNLDRNSQFDQPRASSISNPNSFQHRNLENSREHDLRLGKQHYGSTPPPGFSNKARVAGSGNSRRGFEHNVDMTNRFTSSAVEGGNGVGLTRQLDHPGPPSGINLHSVSALDIEESLLDLRREGRERHLGRDKRRDNGPGYSQGGDDVDDFGEDLVDSLLPDDESELKSDNHERNDKKHRNSRDKEIRSDNRGKRQLSKRMRNLKRHNECRGDTGRLNAPNFKKLFEQVKAVNIDNAVTLTRVISQIFDKALMEPTFCEMYANFCYFLAGELPDFSEDNEKITFKRLLLNKCQEEFERRQREQEEANKADKEGEIKQTEEEREEKRIKARRRWLGNIRLIGELYKKRMLTERIMHECIRQLLGQYEKPDEEDVEALCILMSTIGEMIDHPKATEHMDAYFDRIEKLSNNMKLSSRVRLMLKDSIELRKNKWQQRRKVEGPKKIKEVHRDAAQERQAQASRLARGPSMNSSSRRAPMDFGPRGLSSPTTQMGSFRGLPTQNRGYGGQDVRFEDRQSYEARTLSVPLPQRPIGDESITLGPQGGLARGMSIRGPPAMSSTPLPDISPGAGEPRRIPAGLNGFSSLSERPAYGSREDIIPRYHPDRFAAPPAYDQLNAQERNINYGNRDLRASERSFDRPLATSPTQGQVPSITQNVPSEKVWSEEYLREKSIAAIKEFYSARDEKEVAWCIKDLNSPGFHPSMVSLWVTDSFERKDMERDLLAKLLVNLAKSREGMLSQGQLIKGFESVLTTLEDAVNDAPRAAEFLGRIVAKIVEENMIPLREIGRLLREGGEEPGRLLEIGLAGDVLGSTLEIIKSDKGESVLHEVRMSSNLRLEDFRPPEPNRSRILEKFI